MIMVNPINRLNANNAAYNWMSSANSIMGLCSFSGANSLMLLNSEKQLTSDMFRDTTLYKASLLQEETAKKLSDENIKRTFSTFA
jgi:hypothetical protein